MEGRNNSVMELHRLGLTPREIAKKVDPDYAKNPKAAKERVRWVVRNSKATAR